MYRVHNKNGAPLLVEEGGHHLALTPHLSPMNFARICFSPPEFFNGKSMAARDSTSLKDNVSKCQLLAFRSFPPESAMSAICTGLYGLKGKDSLAGGRCGSGRRSPWLSSARAAVRVPASSAVPAC